MAVGFLSPSPIPQGLTLVTKQDFTTASTIDILGCFSSTYSNYVMTVNLTAASTSTYANFQLLDGSTPSTVFYNFGYTGYTSGASASNAAGFNLSNTYFLEYSSSNTGCTYSQVNFQNPFKSSTTSYTVDIVWDNGSGSTARRGGGFHGNSGSYTGIRLITNTGTITGTVRIYGLQDS